MQGASGNRRVPYAMSVANTVRFPALVARVGRWALLLFPARIARFRQGNLPATLTRLDRLLLAGLISQHRNAGTMEDLAVLFDAFWQADSATDYHHRVANRFESLFLCHHAQRLRTALLEAMAPAPAGYLALCEIGCGSGQVLNWFQQQLPDIQQFIGLDLSAAQTDENRMRWEGSTLRFESGDGAQWIAANARPGWVYLTYGGVFEYFTQRKLVDLFAQMSHRHGPCVLALVEPLADDHDLGTELTSKWHGHESTLSHNYPHLLACTGWVVAYRFEEVVGRQRWLTLVAVTHASTQELAP